MKRRGVLLRLGLGFAAAIGVAIVAALAVTVVELYLTGHGHASIAREILTWPEAGVHMSPSDLVVLIAAAFAGIGAWFLAGGAT